MRSFQAVLGMRRYVQVHRLETPRTRQRSLRLSRSTGRPSCGGTPLYGTPVPGSTQGLAAGQALLTDEARFIDLARSALWLGEEVEIIG